MDILDDPKLKLWLSRYKEKPATQNNYKVAMKLYIEFLKKSPSEIIAEAKADIRDGKFMDERAIFTDLNLYAAHLHDREIAPKSRAAYLAALRSFYNCFYIDVPKVRAGAVKPLEINKPIPSKEDLQVVLSVADPLTKAVILTGVSSGLSKNEIQNLLIRDYKQGYDPETEICTLQLRREKTNTDFITFLTPEATRAINTYLEFRGREITHKDEIRDVQLKKQRVTNDKGYLFIMQKISDEYLFSKDESLRRLSTNAFFNLYQSISVKIGMCAGGGNMNLIRSHNMRKYFNSALLNAGADSFFVEYCMGHTLDDTRAAYFRASPEKLKEIYKKYIPYLTIQKELNVSESPEYQRLKSENEILAREAVRATVENSEIRELREEIRKIKKVNEDIYELRQLIAKSPEAQEIMKKLKE
ncbi:tyrosine-type recombinase/integrase [Methanosarcina sp. T3]|uniref:tyrosine-type recombinase/integrase n=1 Tax=Methanosarcina sp. T3 TaxID=3439062 RepID=UPI003F83ED0E